MDGGARDVLIRAGGPALTKCGVTGVMPNPSLTLYTTAGTKIF